MKRMILPLILLFTGIQLLNSQENFKLSMIKGSDNPNSEKTHYYLFQIDNKANQTQTFTINVEGAICKNSNHREHSKFNFEYYDKSKIKKLYTITVPKNKKKQFVIKTIVPNNSKLSTWNCSNVTLYNPTTKEKQLVSLVSFIQNPKTVN